MIEVVPFEYHHMLALLEGGVLECANPIIDDNVIEMAHTRERHGGKTAILDDRPIACGGITPIWPGVGEVWAFFGPETDRHFMTITRIAKDVVAQMMSECSLHRLQCHVRADFWRGLRLAQYLGFEEEGIAKKYTPDGRDCITYAIVR